MSLSRKAAALTAVAFVAALTPAATAQATPYHCVGAYSLYDTYGYVICGAGTGQVRAVLTCSGEIQRKTYRYGPWVGIGQESWAYCPDYLPWSVGISWQTSG